MQQRQLKSLVEPGRYRPEPSLVAEAMLQRRAVRELLAAWPSSLSAADRTPRLQQPTAGQPDSVPSPVRTSPISVRWVSAVAQRRGRRGRHLLAMSPATRSPRRHRRQAQRIAAGRRGDLGYPVCDRQSAGLDPQVEQRSPRPYVGRRPPSPSLRSIIAVRRLARACRPRRARVRVGERAGPSRPRRRRAPARGRSSSSSPAAAPPISPVRTKSSPS